MVRYTYQINEGAPPSDTEGMMKMAQITTAEFAAALETDTRTVRKFLRAITPKEEQPGKGSRWVLEGNKSSINKMKKRFDEWASAQEKARQEKAETVEAEIDERDEMALDA